MKWQEDLRSWKDVENDKTCTLVAIKRVKGYREGGEGAKKGAKLVDKRAEMKKVEVCDISLHLYLLRSINWVVVQQIWGKC